MWPINWAKANSKKSKSIDFNGAKSIARSIWLSVPGASLGVSFFLLQFVTMKACTDVNFGVQTSLLTRYSHKYVPCSTHQLLISRLYRQEFRKLTIGFMSMILSNENYQSFLLQCVERIVFSHNHPSSNNIIDVNEQSNRVQHTIFN